MRTRTEIQTQFAPTADLARFNRLFFVGIGGAGMLGIARMAITRGMEVHGSDAVDSRGIHDLIEHGATVRIGHGASGIDASMAMILTDAIDLNDSAEVRRARELGIPLFRRSQLLGYLLKDKRVIAITGTHGKTTTTGLVGAALRAIGQDPLIVVGADVPQFGGAVIEGSGDWAVIEACEAYDSFHDLQPEIVLLTNLEPDHLDYHGDWAQLKGSVDRFVAKIPANGALVYCLEDEGAIGVSERFSGEKVGYCHKDIQGMTMPGRHNELNACGALAVAEFVQPGAQSKAEGAVRAFSGAERRLQVIFDEGVTVVDDYAHHPAEIEASIAALRSRYAGRRLVVTFQPHLYSRTAEHLTEFGRTLSAADLLVITDIYPAREDPMPGMSSARIAELATCQTHYVPVRHLLPRFVAKLSKPGDVIVGMGAGNISDFAPGLVKELARKGRKRKVLVAFGGDSAEREVSLHSGRAIANALRDRYDVVSADLSDRLLNSGDLSLLCGPDRPDLVFLAVHGTNMEDGAMQGLCKLFHIPHTGSGIQSSAIAMDKQRTKELLEADGMPVPKGLLVTAAEWNRDRQGVLQSVKEKLLSAKRIVKPNAQGSTVGLSFLDDESELESAISRSLTYDDSCLVEERVFGMEISCPVLGDRALQPVEIVPRNGAYDFGSKYEPGATEEICPARLPENQIQLARDFALRAHRLLKCEGATRTDMLVAGDRIVILEVNTLPGMTATSLLPNSAAACGISFEDLCDWMVQDALARAEVI